MAVQNRFHQISLGWEGFKSQCIKKDGQGSCKDSVIRAALLEAPLFEMLQGLGNLMDTALRTTSIFLSKGMR